MAFNGGSAVADIARRFGLDVGGGSSRSIEGKKEEKPPLSRVFQFPKLANRDYFQLNFGTGRNGDSNTSDLVTDKVSEEEEKKQEGISRNKIGKQNKKHTSSSLGNSRFINGEVSSLLNLFPPTLVVA